MTMKFENVGALLEKVFLERPAIVVGAGIVAIIGIALLCLLK